MAGRLGKRRIIETAALAWGLLMSVAVMGLTVLAIKAASMIKPAVAPTGPLELARHAKTLAMMFGASFLLVAIQLWIALRYASFVPGLVVGIGGTFFAVVATSARQGVFLPLDAADEKAIGKAYRDLLNQKPQDESVGEGVTKELQAL